MLFDKDLMNYFLIGLDAKLRVVNTERRALDKELALEFNPLLQIFDVGENKFSKVLAYFLNPNERHGQGDIFIKSFLKNFNPDNANLDFYKISISTEKEITNERRLDIYIDIDNGRFRIGIESKSHNARDQDNQLSDYNNFLKCEGETNYYLFYMPRYYREPSTKSISSEELKTLKDNKRYACCDISTQFSELLETWIQDCKAQNVRLFLKYLYQYIQHKMNNEQFSGQNEVVADYVISDETNIINAFTIIGAKNDIRKALLKLLESQVKELATKHNIGWDSVNVSGDKFPGFTFKIQGLNKKELWFGFEIEDNEFFYGVLTNGKRQEWLENILKREDMFGDSDEDGHNAYWAWWNWFPILQLDADAFVAIKNGDFVKKVEEILLNAAPKLRTVIDQNSEMHWD